MLKTILKLKNIDTERKLFSSFYFFTKVLLVWFIGKLGTWSFLIITREKIPKSEVLKKTNVLTKIPFAIETSKMLKYIFHTISASYRRDVGVNRESGHSIRFY